MTKSEFVKFVNDFGKVYSDFNPGLTEDAVSRFDERIVFTVAMRSLGGSATLDLDREQVEATVRRLVQIVVSAAAQQPAR